MGVILDTSVLIAIERGALGPDDIARGREEQRFGISVITAAELLHGVHRADSPQRRMKREAYVEKVIETYPLYPFDLAAARIYAELWADLQRRGNRIGAHDLMIGATAISIGFSVATANHRDYKRIEGLTLETLPG